FARARLKPGSAAYTAYYAQHPEHQAIDDRIRALPAALREWVDGPGALRLYVYAGNLDYVVGVEQIEANNPTGRPYLLANPGLASLPVIGQGDPNNAPDPERILTVTPDVIFSTYATEASVSDELQAKIGIPVVAISYGHTGFGATNLFAQGVPDSLKLIGEVIGDSAKAQAAIDFLNQALEDLGQRTAGIPEAGKPSVYVGALGARGAHGIESTQGNYSLLNAIHAKNVVDETGESGSLMIDKEKLLAWDPDYLFIDQGGLAAVLEDYQKNPTFYESLSAVQNGQVYAQLPYNYYNTNIDTALADAYYLGKILTPAAFADVDPVQKADEIYKALLGQPVYAQMTEAFGGFKPLRLREE
ncbi:MAG: iron ABC transporter substrate-binding protein, partial [Anaerolineae bacterium]|nr:iron ABC transporter substrate-binding protein [Anaerolineae bacterium]